jgi:hypothetical protein
MENLNFRPSKSKADFRKNYLLHDLAEYAGKNLLTQWGIKFSEFGQDKRYEALWEKGNDKPDLIISVNNKKAFLDWKGKSSSKWLVNKRAIDAYELWKNKFNLPVIIAFFIFNNEKELVEKKFALLGVHKYVSSPKKQWDKNLTVEFSDGLPDFSKANLIKLLGE